MREQDFRDFLSGRGQDPAQVESAVDAVRDLAAFAEGRGMEPEMLTVEGLRDYFDQLISSGRNTPAHLTAVARYAYFAGRDDLYLEVLGVTGGRTVLPSIAERTGEIAGEGAQHAVFDQLETPPLGSPQADYPPAVAAMVDSLVAEVGTETTRTILAGNHHRVPREAFAELGDILARDGLEAMLAHRRQQLLAVLEEHARSGRPWYEQTITPAVVDYVRADPEIQSGVRRGDYIYVSKIAYAPAEYLAETDPARRRYLKCHCTLARASLAGGGTSVPPLFCYCSAGYEKLPFDVAFGQETEIEVLESVLAGDDNCRFRITVPEAWRG